MKRKFFIKYLITFFVLSFVFACTKYEEPGLINDPNKTYSKSPVVTGVIPKDSAIAGVREIIISGTDFATGGGDTTWVYIGGKPAKIKSISSDRIVIYRPALADDKYGKPIHISVLNPNALGTAKITNYKLEQPVIRYGNFSNYIYNLFAVEVDRQENLFIATRRYVLKFDGREITQSPQLTNDFARITDLKFGPGGYLYIPVDKADIYRMDVSTWKTEKYVTLPNVTSRIDFDEKGNLYTAKANGIYVVNPDKNIISTQKLNGITIVELRVYNGFVYAASSSALYKIPILDSKGNLGEPQLVIDIKSYPEFSNCDLSSFTISNDGSIYLCLKNHPSYSIFVLEKDNTITPFYVDNILPQRVDQIIWGNSRFVYLNRGTLLKDSVRVYKMGMDKNGAPYLGR